jgi:hypothetical protein
MKDEDENIEKWLEGLKNGPSFRVPENYFENFAERLRSRIEKERKPVLRISWITYLKPSLGIAAVLALAFLLVNIPINLSLSDKNSLADQSQVNVPNVRTSNSDGESTASYESLVQLPQSQFLSALEEVFTNNDENQIDPKALEEYLADNSTDYEIINGN